MLLKIFVRQKQSLIDLPDVVIRDRSNLDDYLYEPNSIWTNKESEKVILLSKENMNYSNSIILTLYLSMERVVCFLGRRNVKK